MGRPMGRSMGRPMGIPMGRRVGPPMGRPMAQLGRGHWFFIAVFSRIYVLRIGRFYASCITYFTYNQKRPRIECAYYVSVRKALRIYAYRHR